MTQLTKTSAIRQKETELNAIRKEYAKITKQLDKVKGKLADMQQVLIDCQEPLGRLGGLMAQAREALTKFKEVLYKVYKNKRIPKSERKNAKSLLDEVETDNDFEQMAKQFEIDPETARRLAQEDGEKRQSRFEQLFGAFRSTPPEVEQQQIRKVYLRLATKFHPDKTQDESQAEQFHGIMQHLNNAYEKNDLGALLELERQYDNIDFTLPTLEENAVLNFLNQQIDRLQSEMFLLEQQISRTKDEITALKNSEQGEFITANLKALKNGELGILAQIEIDVKEKIDSITTLYKGYEYYNEHGEFTKEFMNYIQDNGLQAEPDDDEVEGMAAFFDALERIAAEERQRAARKRRKK